jgi:hypothetical protein
MKCPPQALMLKMWLLMQQCSEAGLWESDQIRSGGFYFTNGFIYCWVQSVMALLGGSGTMMRWGPVGGSSLGGGSAFEGCSLSLDPSSLCSLSLLPACHKASSSTLPDSCCLTSSPADMEENLRSHEPKQIFFSVFVIAMKN